MFSPSIADRQCVFREFRLRHGATHLHSLGERALHEFLREFAHHYGLEPEMVEQLERYHRLTPEMVYVAGGDRFPAPFAVLRGGRR